MRNHQTHNYLQSTNNNNDTNASKNNIKCNAYRQEPLNPDNKQTRLRSHHIPADEALANTISQLVQHPTEPRKGPPNTTNTPSTTTFITQYVKQHELPKRGQPNRWLTISHKQLVSHMSSNPQQGASVRVPQSHQALRREQNIDLLPLMQQSQS